VVRQLGSGRPPAGVRADHDHHRHRRGHDSRRNGRATTGRRQLGPQRTGQSNVCSPQSGAVSRSLWCINRAAGALFLFGVGGSLGTTRC
ncbi:unnamed protein product, partial [Ectocarpus sp. 12 AP-2014]